VELSRAREREGCWSEGDEGELVQVACSHLKRVGRGKDSMPDGCPRWPSLESSVEAPFCRGCFAVSISG
jgi:hypothetical protein